MRGGNVMSAMKWIFIFVLSANVVFLAAQKVLPQTSEPGEIKTSRKTPTRTDTTPARRSVKVLLRVEQALPSGVLSAFQTEVLMFIVQVASAEDSRARFKSLIQLRSAGAITVERDSIADRQKQTWKLNPSDFDFVVTWTRHWSAHERSSNYDPLRVSSSETWTVQKTTDPSVTKKWEVSAYTLKGGAYMTAISTAVLARQVESVIVPARAPVLRDLRAFINANTTKTK